MILSMASSKRSCAVGVCDNYYFKTKNYLYEGYPITYHYFPRNVDLCNCWIEACFRDEEFKTGNSFVCSIHFQPEDFIEEQGNSINRKLNDNAIPSRNLTLDEINSFESKMKWVIANRFTSPQNNFKPVDINKKSDDIVMVEKSDHSLEDEVIAMEEKYYKLFKEFEDFKKNSKIEIEKLKSTIKEKDELFTKKLKKILSEYLSETEMDLVMFLRKQKKQLADADT